MRLKLTQDLLEAVTPKMDAAISGEVRLKSYAVFPRHPAGNTFGSFFLDSFILATRDSLAQNA